MCKSAEELSKILESNGYSFVRQRGSHRQYKKAGAGPITVPYKVNKNIELSVLRQIRQNSSKY